MLSRGQEAVFLGVHNLDRLEVELCPLLLDPAEVKQRCVSLRENLIEIALILEFLR